MKLKILVPVVVLGLAVLIGLWQYNLYQNLSQTDMACGGDWSYMATCPFGSYCHSLGQGPLAGGVCKPWLSAVFGIFRVQKEQTYVPSPTPSPIPTEAPLPTPVSFPVVTIQPTSQVISTDYTSPDGSFTVAEEWLGDNNVISIKDEKGVILMDDLVAENGPEIGMNKKYGCMCGISFKGWVSNSLFAIKIVNGAGEEYEFLVEAATGKVDESTFKRVK